MEDVHYSLERGRDHVKNEDTFSARGDVTAACVDQLVDVCFLAADKAGWWTDLKTGESLAVPFQSGQDPKFNVPEKLMLIVSEIGEAMEGHRKNLMDDKLPHRKMIEVELADAFIRICDLAGGLDLDLAGAVSQKLAYNAQCANHKIENRKGEHGKKF